MSCAVCGGRHGAHTRKCPRWAPNDLSPQVFGDLHVRHRHVVWFTEVPPRYGIVLAVSEGLALFANTADLEPAQLEWVPLEQLAEDRK